MNYKNVSKNLGVLISYFMDDGMYIREIKVNPDKDEVIFKVIDDKLTTSKHIYNTRDVENIAKDYVNAKQNQIVKESGGNNGAN